MLSLRSLIAPRRTADAHCDLPCGVYDPDQARIEAESCYKILEKYAASQDETFRTRALIIKEERAELAKHHIDVLWHDYFKPEHVQKFPDLHKTCWEASKQGSKVKASTDIAEARKFIELIDKVGDMWRQAGGPDATRVKKAVAA